MRGKRSKQYRKLMQQYRLSFGFREPYQVLSAPALPVPAPLEKLLLILAASPIVDAQMMQDAHRFKMDLVKSLTQTFHGQIKPSALPSPLDPTPRRD